MDIWIFLPKNSDFVKSRSKLIEIAVHREQTTGDVDVSICEAKTNRVRVRDGRGKRRRRKKGKNPAKLRATLL